MRGYTQTVVEANQKAEPSLAVMLGTLCISTKYPVSQVAKELGVSRQTVYSWFSGRLNPTKKKALAVAAMIERLAPGLKQTSS